MKPLSDQFLQTRFAERILFLLLFLASFSTLSFSQVPVAEYILEDLESTPEAPQTVPGYTVPSINSFPHTSTYVMRYGVRSNATNGNTRIVKGFRIGGTEYRPYSSQTGRASFTRVVINRREPSTPLGNKYTALYEYSAITNSENQPIPITNVNSITIPSGSNLYLEPNFEESMESFLNSFAINKGTDNLFVNDPGLNTHNNIERVDLVYSHGIVANTDEDRSRIGFLLNERNGNDNYTVAVITGIDEDNNVTSFGNLKSFNQSTWGKTGPNITTIVVQKPGGSTDYSPSQIIGTQTVSGVFISLAALEVVVNQRVYGISLFPEDVGSDLVNLTDAATDTDGSSGLDLMSGNFVAKESALIYPKISGSVFHDTNGLNGIPLNTVDGTLIYNPEGVQLHANLLDANDIVVATYPIDTDGTYEFIDVPPGPYRIQLTTEQGTPLQAMPESKLPTGWEIYTGESNNGIGTESDGTPDGFTSITVSEEDIENINFGIQQPPVATNSAYTLQSRPASGTTVPLNNTVVASGGGFLDIIPYTDPDDAVSPLTITFTQLPLTNQGNTPGNIPVLLYNGNPVEEGTPIPAFEPDKLSVVLEGQGYTSIEFAFTVTDIAGAVSSPATYTVDWNGTLPVKLQSFEVSEVENTPRLVWVTVSEYNSDRFEIQRINAGHWLTIGIVKASGMSATDSRYNFSDNNPAEGINTYRLKMVDVDGTMSYSHLVSAKINTPYKIYPNPANQNIELRHSDLSGLRRLILVDPQGVARFTSQTAVSKIDVRGLPPGLYIILMEYRDGTRKTHKVTVF